MARRSTDIYTEWRGGTCRVKWWTGEYHESGRKRFESKGGFPDEDTAFKHGQDQMHDIRHGVHVSNRDSSTSMEEWLADWLASLELAHLTLRNYRSAIDAHIRPYFGSMTVGEVSILNVRAFKTHLGRVLGKDSSRSGIMMVLGMVMDDAVEAGLRKASPVERKRRRGKYKKKPRERKKDMPIEVVDRLARNAEIVFGYSGYVMIWTMAMTGMRPGELYGLTREYCAPNWPKSDPRTDPDEADRYDEDLLRYGEGDGLLPAIRVERQVQYEDGALSFHPPKYGSFRTLVIPLFLADMLQKLMDSHDSNWVFTSVSGGCLGAMAFSHQYWRPIADGRDGEPGGLAALPRVPTFAGKRFYLIRHGHKEWLDEDGHARYVVETRMGHELPGVEGTYSNLTPRLERQVAEALQRRWEEFRSQLSDEDAVEVLPKPAVPSVAALVREVMGRGITAKPEVLAEVRKVKPAATYGAVSDARLRVLKSQGPHE